MKKIILGALLLLLLSVPYLLAANTMTSDGNTSGHPWYKTWVMSFDSVGTLCAQTINHQSRYVVADLTAGTIVYDVESAIVDNPNETGQSIDLASGTDLAADAHFTQNALVPWLCVRVSTCTGCVMTVTIEGGS